MLKGVVQLIHIKEFVTIVFFFMACNATRSKNIYHFFCLFYYEKSFLILFQSLKKLDGKITFKNRLQRRYCAFFYQFINKLIKKTIYYIDIIKNSLLTYLYIEDQIRFDLNILYASIIYFLIKLETVAQKLLKKSFNILNHCKTSITLRINLLILTNYIHNPLNGTDFFLFKC